MMIIPENTVLVVLGASGDLARKKLVGSSVTDNVPTGTLTMNVVSSPLCPCKHWRSLRPSLGDQWLEI